MDEAHVDVGGPARRLRLDALIGNRKRKNRFMRRITAAKLLAFSHSGRPRELSVTVPLHTGTLLPVNFHGNRADGTGDVTQPIPARRNAIGRWGRSEASPAVRPPSGLLVRHDRKRSSGKPVATGVDSIPNPSCATREA